MQSSGETGSWIWREWLDVEPGGEAVDPGDLVHRNRPNDESSVNKRRTAKDRRSQSEVKAKEPQGRPYLSIPKRHYTSQRGRERSGTENQRRNNGEERSEHTASLQNLQRNFGGIPE